jgi:uncharacterized protein YjiS (DUF1127 family)
MQHLQGAYSDWRRRQAAYDELSALDDRSLADIGIHRSEIPAIVEGFHDVTQRAAAPARMPAAVLAARQSRLATAHRWLPPL